MRQSEGGAAAEQGMECSGSGPKPGARWRGPVTARAPFRAAGRAAGGDGLRRGRPPAAAEPQERTGRVSGARKVAACVPGGAGRARCRAPAGEEERAEIPPRGGRVRYRRPHRPLDADGVGSPRTGGTRRGTQTGDRVPLGAQGRRPGRVVVQGELRLPPAPGGRRRQSLFR